MCAACRDECLHWHYLGRLAPKLSSVQKYNFVEKKIGVWGQQNTRVESQSLSFPGPCGVWKQLFVAAPKAPLPDEPPCQSVLVTTLCLNLLTSSVVQMPASASVVIKWVLKSWGEVQAISRDALKPQILKIWSRSSTYLSADWGACFSSWLLSLLLKKLEE